MSPAPLPSLPCASPADERPSLNRQTRRWLAGEVRRLQPTRTASAAASAADRYRKHFTAVQHAWLLLFHGLSGSASLRRTHHAFPNAPGLVAASGLATDPTGERLTLSFSQFAASTTSRPAAFLAGLVAGLVARVRAQGGRPGSQLPPDLRVLDSTFLRLPLRLVPWLAGAAHPSTAGVRLLVLDAPAADLPEHVVITDTHHNDCQGLDAAILADPARLATLRGQTLVLDLGYYSPARFARLRTAGVHFISRRQAQATLVVEAEQPVQPPLPGLDGGRITVHRDQGVTLGSPNNRAGAVLPGLRLVTAEVAPAPRAARSGGAPVVYELLTDRWDLSAAEVVQGYLWRWQIELFFRWLKRQVGLPRWLGYSRNAVELTVWLAIAVHLLLVLLAWARGQRRRSPALLDDLRWALAHLRLTEVGAPAHQLAFPGWLIDAVPPPCDLIGQD